MSSQERAIASRCVTDRFLNSRYFLASDSIGCYLAAWDEVDTSAIFERAWRAKKRIFSPVIGPRHSMSFHEILPETTLTRNHFGLWEPRSKKTIFAADLDVVVTPLVAFDGQRNRIGMGSGYYDRRFAFLGNRRKMFRPKLIGLAFDCQKVEKITPNPWDIRLYRVFAESQ